MKKNMLNRVKNVFKAVLLNNFPYKLLSVVIAVAAWLIIINVADPVTTRTFKNLKVEAVNNSAIYSINQVYEIVEGDTVDFTVRGKSSIIKNLSIGDFKATADLSKLSPVYAADINVVCNKTENIEIDSGNEMMVVKLEDIARKNMQVEVETTGEAADGYYVGDYEVKPNMIMVAGGKSKIDRVDSVKVSVDVSGAKKSFDVHLVPVAYDKDGNELDPSHYTFYNGEVIISDIRVSVTINNTKTLPVEIDVKGEPDPGYVYDGEYEFTPETVTVGGSNRRLSKLESLEIPVDISGATESYEVNADIATYLPPGVALVSEEENISVRVTLKKIVSNSMIISLDDIEMRNLKEGLTASFTDQSTGVSLTLNGTDEQVDQYTSENAGAYIDLSNVGPGLWYVSVKYSNIPANLIISDSVTVAVNVSEEGDLEETGPPGT